METKAEVEKLVDWRIATLPGDPTVADVIESFRRGTFNAGESLPEGVTIEAVHAFRKRSDDAKRRYVVRAFARLKTAAVEPVMAPPGGVPLSPVASAEIKPIRSPALAEIAQLTSLELEEVAGEVYITLRCFEQLIGKRPDHLRRTLEARGFPITEVSLPNAAGNTRPTPAIHVAYIFAVVGLADLHGMDELEKERLFKLQREMPTWMKKFDEIIRANEPKAEPSLFSLMNTISAKILTTVQDGLAKLASRFDLRFDRIEHLLRVSGVGRPSAPVSVPRDLERVNGTRKISSRHPLKSIHEVVKDINQHLNTCYTPEDIVEMAKTAGIYEREFYGMNKVGLENSTVLESGDLVTWWFDLDARDILKDIARRECQAVNGATSTLS